MKVSKKSHRLALRFSESDPPRLEKTYFWFGQSQSPVEQSFDGTVKGLAWDKGAMSLCYWLIQYRISKHHPDDGLYEVPQDGQTDLFATLLNLLDSPRQFDDVFGKEPGMGANSRAVLKLIFPQTNPRKHRKATIDPAQLATDALIIKRGANDVAAVPSLKKLLAQIANAYAEQPSRKKEESEKAPSLTPTIPPPQEPSRINVAANDDVISEALASISSLPAFSARDIATEDELYRLWQIDCSAYGEHAITFEQFLAQWQAFPHFPKALFFQNEIAAAIGILPTTEARMKDFAEGRVSEASLQDDPLGKFMIGNVNAWLIDGMVRNPKFPMAATRELVCSSILSWINDGLISYPLNIYAIGQNRRGMNLITRAGFKLIKTAESLPDGMPFYFLHIESEAQLLRLLLERLRCYASITP